MARIIINRGFISQGGQLYKAGEIVEIADVAEAKRIVARSGGDFDFYQGESVVNAKTEEQPVEGEGDVSESDTSASEAEMAGGELPAIDAEADMQSKKSAGSKKK